MLVRGETTADYRDRARARWRKGRHRLTHRSRSGVERAAARGRRRSTCPTSPIVAGRSARLHRAVDGADRLRAAEHGRQVHRPAAADVVRDRADAARPPYRYSVIFSNEDGGTQTDRLMATWGRTTDIEFVYGVEVDGSGRISPRSSRGRGTRCRRSRAGTRAATRCCGYRPTTTWSARPGRPNPLRAGAGRSST